MKTDEREPLLAQTSSENTPEDDSQAEKRHWIESCLPKIHVFDSRYRFLPLIGCLLVLINEGEYFFKQIGYFRGIEALYCIEYYQKHDPDIAKLGKKIPESMCKLDSIQKNVATANGIIIVIRMTAAFIGTMPLGYLADRIGRRFAQIMHKIGVLMYTIVVVITYVGYPTVPIWVSFLGGLGGLIGSNIDLNLSVMLASYTDTMSDKSQRASWFFITTSMQYVGQVAFPLAAGRAINLDGQGGTPEVALFISLALASLNLLICVILWPETLQHSKEDDNQRRAPDAEYGDTKASNIVAILRSKLQSFSANFQQSVHGLGTLNLVFLAISIFLATSAIKSVDWLGLVQYPVIKFGWKYNQSTYAMAIQAIVYIFTYFLLLPTYTRLGNRYGLTTSSTSLLVMLGSLVFLEAGAVFLGFSSTAAQFIAATCIYTLGAGMPAVMQAYIANLVEKSSLGRLLAILSLFQVAGKVCASGVGPLIIKAGIDSGNEYLKGSIFFWAAVLFLFSASALGIVAMRAGVLNGGDEEDVSEAGASGEGNGRTP